MILLTITCPYTKLRPGLFLKPDVAEVLYKAEYPFDDIFLEQQNPAAGRRVFHFSSAQFVSSSDSLATGVRVSHGRPRKLQVICTGHWFPQGSFLPVCLPYPLSSSWCTPSVWEKHPETTPCHALPTADLIRQSIWSCSQLGQFTCDNLQEAQKKKKPGQS